MQNPNSPLGFSLSGNVGGVPQQSLQYSAAPRAPSLGTLGGTSPLGLSLGPQYAAPPGSILGNPTLGNPGGYPLGSLGGFGLGGSLGGGAIQQPGVMPGYGQLGSLQPGASLLQPSQADLELQQLQMERQRLLQASHVPKADSGLQSLQATMAKLEALKKANTEMSTQLINQSLQDLKKTAGQTQKGVDLCFVVDCSFSMDKWIEAVRDKIKLIVDETKAIEKNIVIRVAFVGYRDYPPPLKSDSNSSVAPGSNDLEYLDFTDNVGQFVDFVSKVKARGGHDIPEDVAGGLHQALKLNWKYNTKLCIHICDSPAHGDRYGPGKIEGWSDNYPKGDPMGLDPDDLIVSMSEKRIDYYFAKIHWCTKNMEESFQRALKSAGKMWTPLSLDASVDAFKPAVIQSISASVRNTGYRGE